MLYAFSTGVLEEDRYKLDVKNITVEVTQGEAKKGGPPNDCLNGKLTIKGLFENVCRANESKIKAGSFYKLKFQLDGKWTILPVLALELLDVGNVDKFFRNYTWLFCCVQKPWHDQIGLLPTPTDLTLDDLLEMIGASRGKMEREKRIFDAEGGYS